MSTRVALIKHDRPRILMIDFSERDANKIRSLGYNVRIGKSGNDQSNKYSIPWALQDIEILAANVSPGSFSELHLRSRDPNCIEEGPYFEALLAELWNRQGWAILFIQQGIAPDDLSALGILNIGAVSIGGQLYSSQVYRANREYFVQKQLKASPPFIPQFKGEAVIIEPDQSVNQVLRRHLHAAKMSILSVDGQPSFEGGLRSRADH